ncbi:MAG: glycosyltransferase family 4 protein [Candidatus Wolfebacteria bacterium]|nr:glycosyltransferase family 4 protein [Candidatus Wolfebacteria bacterium]
MRKYKLAVLTSHPIQYQAPLFKKISGSGNFDLMVYFNWVGGSKAASFDKEFGQEVKWDTPLLEGYSYKFLDNFSLRPSSGFLGQINPDIVKEILANRYDAIIVMGWNSFTNWLAFLTAFISRTPVFLRGENPLNQEIIKNPFKLKLKKMLFRLLFRGIKKFLYIGEENKKFYEYYGVSEEKLVFCPYAVDNERFVAEARKLKPQKNELRRKLGITRESPVILFVGKLIEKKRPMDLLRAYELLITNYKLPKLPSLLFVGDGELRSGLENYAKDNNISGVHFAGFKNQSEISEYYAIADILVLPSGAGETWGLAVNEAMCFGSAVVISDMVGCGPDLIKNGENGYIFPLGDIKLMASRFGDLMSDPLKMKSFSEKSLEIIGRYSYNEDIQSIKEALAGVKKHG